jgi:demethylmenaquinone methyltransferase/2-methoxy-6-polyprenyl-1,4-benzoquinol methylase
MARLKRSKNGAGAHYDRISSWYDIVAGPGERKFIRAGLKLLHADCGDRILEIGSGTGWALRDLAAAVDSGGMVSGIDLSMKMIRKAVDRGVKGYSGRQPALMRGTGTELPCRSHTFDAVFMSFTLELFETRDIARVLGECRRVLKRQGRIVVVSLSGAGGRRRTVEIYEWLHRRFPAYVDCRPIFVEDVVRGAGFEIVETLKMSMWGLPVDLVLAETGS